MELLTNEKRALFTEEQIAQTIKLVENGSLPGRQVSALCESMGLEVISANAYGESRFFMGQDASKRADDWVCERVNRIAKENPGEWVRGCVRLQEECGNVPNSARYYVDPHETDDEQW